MTKVKAALPQLNLSFSRRKYCAILRILAAVSGSSDSSTTSAPALPLSSPSSTPRNPTAAGIAPASASVSESKGRATRADPSATSGGGQPARQEAGREGSRGADDFAGQAGSALAAWKTLEVSVCVAPQSAISLVLQDEDSDAYEGAGADGGVPASASRCTAIAVLSIRNVSISYATFGDESSLLEAGIGVVEACDTRPRSSNKFRHLIFCPNSGSSSTRKSARYPPLSEGPASRKSCSSVLQLKMYSDVDGSELVTWLGHMQVFVIKDALMAMLGVFQGPDEASSAAATAPPPAAAHSKENGADMSERKARQGKDAAGGGGGGGLNEGTKAKKMGVQVIVEKPRLIIVEDCEDSESSMLVIQTCFMAKQTYHADGGCQGLAHVQDFCVYVQEGGMAAASPGLASFAEAGHLPDPCGISSAPPDGGISHPSPAYVRNILEPACASVEYSVGQEVLGDREAVDDQLECSMVRIWVMSPGVEVTITYQEARMIQRMLDMLSSPAATTTTTRASTDATLASDMDSSPARSAAAALEKSSAETAATSRADASGEASTRQVEASAQGKHVRVDLGDIQVTIVNDCAGYNQPFVTLSLFEAHAVHVEQPSALVPQQEHFVMETCSVLRARTQASVFNQRILQFEPVMEEWAVAFEMSLMPSRPDDTSSTAGSRKLSPERKSGDLREEWNWLDSRHVESHEVLNLNLTEHHMNTVCTTLLAWQTDMDMESPCPKPSSDHQAQTTASDPCQLSRVSRRSADIKAAKYAAYRICNRSGLGLRVVRVAGRLSEAEEHGQSGRRGASRASQWQCVPPMTTHPLCFADGLWASMVNVRGPSNGVPDPLNDFKTQRAGGCGSGKTAAACHDGEESQPCPLNLRLAVENRMTPGVFRGAGGVCGWKEGDGGAVGGGSLEENGLLDVDLRVAGRKVSHLVDGSRIMTQVDIDKVSSSTLITVMSAVTLENKCHVPLFIKLYRESGHGMHVIHQGVLAPFSTVCLPPSITMEEGECEMAVRPMLTAQDDVSPLGVDGEYDGGNTCAGGEGLTTAGRFAASPMTPDSGQEDADMAYGWSDSVLLATGLDQVVSCTLEGGGLSTPRFLPSKEEELARDAAARQAQDGCGATPPRSPCLPFASQDFWFVRTVAEITEEKLGGVGRARGRRKLAATKSAGADRSGHDDADDEKFVRTTVILMPVLLVRNVLPCSLNFAFLIEGDAAPQPSYQVASGGLLAVHAFALSRKVSMGLAVAGLEEASEFVPVFCPDGTAPENHVTLYDTNRSILRLSLEHQQKALHVFQIQVYAPYWIINRTDLPLQLGQKWTASNVTLVGGQCKAPPGAATPTSLAGDPGLAATDASDDDVAEAEDEHDGLHAVRCCSAGLGRAGRSGGSDVPLHSESGAGAGAQRGGGEKDSLRDVLQGSGISPMPFSFHWKVDVGGAKATVRLGAPFMRYSAREGAAVPCSWSSPFSIDSIGERPLELVGDGFSVDVVVRVSMGDGLLRRTRMVTLLPRYVVCNSAQQPVEICQVGAEDTRPMRLDPGSYRGPAAAPDARPNFLALAHACLCTQRASNVV